MPSSEEWFLKNEAFSLSHSLLQCFHPEVSRCARSGVPGTAGQPWLSSFFGMGEAHSRCCPVAAKRASRAFPRPPAVYHVALQPCPTIPTPPSLGVCLCDLVCAPVTCRAGVLGALTNAPVFFLPRSPISLLSDLAVFQDRLRMLTVGGTDTPSLSFPAAEDSLEQDVRLFLACNVGKVDTTLSSVLKFVDCLEICFSRRSVINHQVELLFVHFCFHPFCVLRALSPPVCHHHITELRRWHGLRLTATPLCTLHPVHEGPSAGLWIPSGCASYVPLTRFPFWSPCLRDSWSISKKIIK